MRALLRPVPALSAAFGADLVQILNSLASKQVEARKAFPIANG
jgi:hypothetical protein